MTRPKSTIFSIPLPYVGIPGVEAIWEYDDWIANERTYVDLWRIDEIGGIDDAELRDHREPNPDQPGETAYEAFAGGRTITFTGKLTAGNVQLMRSFWAQMSAAMANLTERPLYARMGTPGIYDQMQYDSRPFYTFALGGGTVIPGESNMAPTALNEKLFYYTYRERLYQDVDVVIENQLSGTWTGAGVRAGAVVAYIDPNNYLVCELVPGGWQIRSVNNGVSTILGWKMLIFFGPTAGAKYWIRGRKVGNVVRCELWGKWGVWANAGEQFPPDQTSEDTYVETVLTGSDAAKFGAGTSNYVGVDWVPAGTDERIGSFVAKPLNPEDVMFLARKSGGIQMRDSQTNNLPERAFMIPMRAANPRAMSAVLNETLITQYTYTTYYGRVFTETWNKAFTTQLDSTGKPATGPQPTPTGPQVLVNRGNFEADTIIRIYGPITNAVVTNVTAGTQLRINGLIGLDTIYFEINSKAGTVTNSNGINKYGQLDHTSDTMKMLKGSNLWTMTGDGVDPSRTKVKIAWRDSWM